MGISLLLQLSVLSLLALAPLVYTESLPRVDLKRLLLAPSPPSAPPPFIRESEPVNLHASPRRFVFPSSLTAIVPRRADTGNAASTPPPEIGVVGSVGDAANIGVLGAIGSTPGPLPPPPAPREPTAPKRVRVSSILVESNLVYRVQPVYPALAKTTRVQGVVEFTAIISKEGKIENLQLVRGHPLLVKAAKDAVLQWRYKPTLLNGQPVEVVTSILVNFTLNQ